MSRWTLRAPVASLAALALAATPVLADTGHGTMPSTTHAAPKGMTVKVKLTKDPMKGWNLNAATTGFRWAPQRASGMHRQGEGHAHLYLDGVKLTRLYGSWYYLGDLKPGRHTIKVTLNGNDHGDYVRGGKAVAASATVTVPKS